MVKWILTNRENFTRSILASMLAFTCVQYVMPLLTTFTIFADSAIGADQLSMEIEMPVSTGSTYNLDPQEIHKIQERAENGEIDSILRLYRYFEFVALDEQSSTAWLIKAAKAGHAVSQFNLAHYYLRKKMDEEARYWALEALNNGIEDAAEILSETN